MTNLFDATKNPLFRLMCTLVNEICAGAKLTRTDIYRRILSLPSFNYLETPDKVREEKIIDAVFKFPPPKHFAKVCLDLPIAPLFSDAEFSWLKTMLLDDETAFLFPLNLREKLLMRLENIPSLYNLEVQNKFRLVKSNKNSAQINFHTLAVIVDALNKRRKLDSEIIPCRLEYDFLTGEYSVIAWNESKSSVEKIPVEQLDAVTISAETIPLDVEEKLQKFYQHHTIEVNLLLRNTRNAVERCFALFGSYDKKSRYQNDDTYFLTISCYDFEENEVFEKILSLGSAVTVLSPENLRRKIIEHLRAIKKLYAD